MSLSGNTMTQFSHLAWPEELLQRKRCRSLRASTDLDRDKRTESLQRTGLLTWRQTMHLFSLSCSPRFLKGSRLVLLVSVTLALFQFCAEAQGRLFLTSPARRHSKRSLLRLPFECRRLPRMASLDAQNATATAGDLG
jgi:hypothetical protein